ncbi:MAG: nucleotide exchange factor GrpE [Candidatus Helarchaeota archaeon]|nr:nucleotide exchange factor GrpE [Candidatus Helarchaeota archaeon]
MDLESEFEVQDNNLEEETVLITSQEYDALKKKAIEAKELHEKYLRLLAEFENYKKFMERQKTNCLKFGNEKLLKAILKIYDDLKRALNGHVHADFPQADGLKLILENLSTLLKSEGVEPIEAEGRAFNPAVHECIMVEQDPSLPEGEITEVLEEGYYLNDKVLRPARVKINK